MPLVLLTSNRTSLELKPDFPRLNDAVLYEISNRTSLELKLS